MSHYDAAFFDYTSSLAVRSAEHLLPHLLKHLHISSVADFGCGQGAWLSVWKKLGVRDVLGIDGDYVEPDQLLVEPAEFVPHDLSTTLDLGRRFDIVQSLEVAEHLPLAASNSFVDTLIRHGQIIFFSAAPRGQGGVHHINEQDYGFWRDLFAARGYVLIDSLRRDILHDRQIEPWYRYNSFLFVNDDSLVELPSELARHLIPATEPVPDVSPPLYKLRKWIFGHLPLALMTPLAKAKDMFLGQVCKRVRRP